MLVALKGIVFASSSLSEVPILFGICTFKGIQAHGVFFLKHLKVIVEVGRDCGPGSTV